MGFDEVADALGHRTRRQLLVELVEHNPVAVGSVCERDNDKTALIHNHLPKLDSMEYISWNRDQGTIVKGANWTEIEPVVRLLHNNREATPNDTF